MASNSSDGHPTRDQTVTDAKIQLLTNQIEKDYALRLKGKSELLAVTNPYAEYTKVIAESDYFETGKVGLFRELVRIGEVRWYVIANTDYFK